MSISRVNDPHSSTHSKGFQNQTTKHHLFIHKFNQFTKIRCIPKNSECMCNVYLFLFRFPFLFLLLFPLAFFCIGGFILHSLDSIQENINSQKWKIFWQQRRKSYKNSTMKRLNHKYISNVGVRNYSTIQSVQYELDFIKMKHQLPSIGLCVSVLCVCVVCLLCNHEVTFNLAL